MGCKDSKKKVQGAERRAQSAERRAQSAERRAKGLKGTMASGAKIPGFPKRYGTEIFAIPIFVFNFRVVYYYFSISRHEEIFPASAN